MLRTGKGLNRIVDVDTADQIEPTVESLGADRYYVGQILRDAFPSGHPSRSWVGGFKPQGEPVVIEPVPWGSLTRSLAYEA